MASPATSATRTSGAGRSGLGLRLSLLGPVRAWRDGIEIDLGTPQQRLVLAILAMRSGSASLDALVDTVWSGHPPARAVSTIRTYVYRLRRALEPSERRPDREPPRIVVRAPSGYVLRLPPGTLDLDQVQTARAEAERAQVAGDHARAALLLRGALDQWRAEPLEGLTGAFAEAQRERLEELRRTLLETWFDSALALGDHREVLPELTALAARYPLRERLRAQLMLALARAGRQAEALEVYARTRRMLVETLGIEPGTALQVAHRQVLAGEAGAAGSSSGSDPDSGAGPGAGAGSAAGGAGASSVGAGERGVDSASPGGGQVPRMVPGDVAGFAGRTTEVSWSLDALSATGRAPAVVLTGIGGVGKTALAVHTAHLVRSWYPDGQLYADLRGMDADPADPDGVLRMFLHALGVRPEEMGESLEDCAATYHAALGSLRVLVVLDNAHDAAQVRPLLPGAPGSAAIVTTRARLPGLSAATTIPLDVLDVEDARAMLGGVIGHHRVRAEPEAADRLLQAVEYLPLAVRILASRLAARPAWSIAALADLLVDERRRLAEIESGELGIAATFRLGYDQLLPELRGTFVGLARYARPTLRLGAAAAVLDLPAAEAETRCETLVDAGLLESPAPGRYGYHDLLRLFGSSPVAAESGGDTNGDPVGGTARGTDGDAIGGTAADPVGGTAADPVGGTVGLGSDPGALRRLLDVYLATGKRLLNDIEPHDPVPSFMTRTAYDPMPIGDAPDARAWAMLEAEPMLAACRLAADLAGTDAEAREPGDRADPSDPSDPGDPGDQCGPGDQARRCLELATDLTIVLWDAIDSGAVLDRVGDVAQSLGQAAARIGDERTEGRALVVHGYSLVQRGEPVRGAEVLERACAAGRTSEDVYHRARAEYILVGVYIHLHRYDEALALGQTALDGFRATGSRYDEGATLGLLARVLAYLDRHAEGIASARESIDVNRALGSVHGEAFAWYGLGTAHARAGELARAVEDLRTSRALFERANRRLWVGFALAREAEVQVERGAADAASRAARSAADITRELGHHNCYGRSLTALGHAARLEGDVAGARGYWLEAYDVLHGIGAPLATTVAELLAALPGKP